MTKDHTKVPIPKPDDPLTSRPITLNHDWEAFLTGWISAKISNGSERALILSSYITTYRPSTRYSPYRSPSKLLENKPINDTVTQFISLTKPSASAPIQPNPFTSTTYPIDPIQTSGNVGSRNLELNNCERTTHLSTNCGEYQLLQTRIKTPSLQISQRILTSKLPYRYRRPISTIQVKR